MNLWDFRVTALLGAALWGSWALFVNWDAGLASAALSAGTQAAVSASSITLLGVIANFVLGRPWKSPRVQMIAGTLVPWGALLSLVVGAHLVVHTHDILRTIAPSASIGLTYSAIYAYKNRRRREPDAPVIATDPAPRRA